MNANRCLMAALFAACTAQAASPIVVIGRAAIPLEISCPTPTPVTTNRLAKEFTAYFQSSSDIGKFFRTNGVSTANGFRMVPAGHDGGPPPEAAIDIRYFGAPVERITVGERAISWLADQIDSAAPFTNTWSQAELLLASINDCSITNDMETCRESFVVGGSIFTNAAEDVRLAAGIASYWSRLKYSPPNLFGFRMVRLVEDGPELPALYCRCTDPEAKSDIAFSVILVYLENRWRMILQ